MASFGDTVTNGIQDISALLPLLGTEQCETHVSSALDKGFLYAAATPLSIFGSLGVVQAGFKVFFASLSFVGAKWLDDAGFAPDRNAAADKNVVSLLAIAHSRFVAEDRLDEMLEKARIDDVDMVGVVWHIRSWNLCLLLSVFLCAPFALVPYLPLILDHEFHPSPLLWGGWLFPVLRVYGTSLTVIMIQAILQIRILEITRKCLLVKQLETGTWKDALGDIDLPSFTLLSADERIWKIRQKLKTSSPTRKATPSAAGFWSKWLRRRRSVAKTAIIDPEAAANALNHPAPLDSSTLPAAENLEATQKPSFNQNPPPSPNASSELPSKEHLLRREHLLELIDGCRVRWLPMFQILIFGGVVMSIVGYIGCFSIVQSSVSAGPVVWIAVEVALSVIRIMIWASNPTWDEHTDMLFSLKLIGKPPRITCLCSQETISKLKTFSALRVDDFLMPIEEYSGPIEPIVQDKIMLYYTLTGSTSTNRKVLYVTISDYGKRASWTWCIDSWASLYNITSCTVNSLYSVIVDVEPFQDLVKVTLDEKVDKNNPITRDRVFSKKLMHHCTSIMQGIRLRQVGGDCHAPVTLPTVLVTWSLSIRYRLTGRPPLWSDWPSLEALEITCLKDGNFRQALSEYAERRTEWIEEGVRILRANATQMLQDRQSRMQNLVFSGLLADLETYSVMLVDLEEQQATEILWISEVFILTSLSSFQLQLKTNKGRPVPQLQLEWQAWYHAEQDSALVRLRGHSTIASGRLEPGLFNQSRWTAIVEESCRTVKEIWETSANPRPSPDLISLHAFFESIQEPLTPWLSHYDYIATQLEQSLVIGRHYDELKGEELKFLRQAQLQQHQMRRIRMQERQRAEKESVHARLRPIVEDIQRASAASAPQDVQSASRSNTGLELPSDPNAELVDQLISNLTLALEAFLQPDVPRMLKVVFNDRKHCHLDIMTAVALPLEEYCEMLIRNQSAAVVSLGSPAYPTTTSATLQECASALRQRIILTSVVLNNVELNNSALEALHRVATMNRQIVSIQFRDPSRRSLILAPDLVDSIMGAVERNRDFIESHSRQTDVIYEHDPEGFWIQGCTRGRHEDEVQCTVYFTAPDDATTTLYIRLIIEGQEFGEIRDPASEPLCLRLNDTPLPLGSSLTGPSGTRAQQHYHIEMGHGYRREPFARNRLNITANPNYGSNAVYLIDLVIHDELGFEWHGPAPVSLTDATREDEILTTSVL